MTLVRSQKSIVEITMTTYTSYNYIEIQISNADLGW